MILKFLKKLFLRRHVFDLSNPIIRYEQFTYIEAVVTYPVYTCLRCGKELALNGWQMKRLPRSMSHGCLGRLRWRKVK